MELWVRSQNRRCLVKIHSLIIEKNEAGNRNILVNYERDNETYLGTYKTEERVLEILDEIQDLLRYVKLRKYTADALVSVENNTALYIMPEE